MAKPFGTRGGVEWFLPEAKRPFAYSTKATSDLIEALAQYHMSVRESRKRIIFDYEARAILQYVIDAGYGDVELHRFLWNVDA